MDVRDVAPTVTGSTVSDHRGRLGGEYGRIGRRGDVLDGAANAGVHHSDPLRSYSRYCTSDPDRAVTEVTKLMAPHEMVLNGPSSGFSAEGSMAELGDFALGYMVYRQDVTFYCPPEYSFVSIALPLRSGISIALDGMDAVDIQVGSAFVVPTRRKFTMNWRDDAGFMVLRARATALEHFLQKLAPEVGDKSLQFVGAAGDAVAGAALGGLAKLIAAVCERYQSSDRVPRILRNELRDHVLTSMLMSLEHTHTNSLYRAESPLTSRTVRLALEIMGDDARSEVTVSGIASTLGVSLRTLELGFRRELNCTPRSYLRSLRLYRAHEELQKSSPGDGVTVTEVAMRCGFGHIGRFAAEYRRVFGESPSAALRSMN